VQGKYDPIGGTITVYEYTLTEGRDQGPHDSSVIFSTMKHEFGHAVNLATGVEKITDSMRGPYGQYQTNADATGERLAKEAANAQDAGANICSVCVGTEKSSSEEQREIDQAAADQAKQNSKSTHGYRSDLTLTGR
jgi:hypothetical protein